MTLTITDTLMTSDATSHQAAILPLAEAWTCTWCSELRLDRNQAITAMTIAEEVERGSSTNVDLIVSLAHELDLLGYEAVQRCFAEAEGTARSAAQEEK